MATTRRTAPASTPISRRKAKSPAAALPDQQAIARRAYELFLERGSTEGDERTDWLKAEQELSGTPPPGKATP